jgi:hypothetical protein
MSRKRQSTKSALELIEEAIHLLRASPISTLSGYYLGALPFVLGLLYFWTDMSRSAFAASHLAEAALGLSALFLWMKFWQGFFCATLRAHLIGGALPAMTLRRCGRILFSQTVLQPAGLFLLPLAFVTVVPFPWVYAFFQTASARADAEGEGLTRLILKSLRESRLWPGQNLAVLAILAGFGLYVFLNWATVCFILPGLVKVLFGIETMFTRSAFSLLNTTFFAAIFWLTYLCVDPVLKAVYVLRCFYGESRQSGDDLKAELRQFTRIAKPVVASLAILVALAAPIHAAPSDTPASGGARPSSSAQPAPIAPPKLDEAIQDTIQHRKYSWRAPRTKFEKPEKPAEENFLTRLFDRVRAALGRFFRRIGGWIDWLLRRIFGNPGQSSPKGSGYNWILLLQFLLWVLAAAAIAGIAVFLYRMVRDRQRKENVIASEPIQPTPDLTDENVGAEQLPEDGWTKLARELLARGEFRLALRAFYLASLASLATRNLITLAKFKSNRDYERELGRRGHSFPELRSIFGQNVSVFDRIWYGLHETNAELVNQFATNVERIKTGA